MTATAPTHPLEHWASYPGVVTLRQGEHTARLDAALLVLLLRRAQSNATGTVRHLGITLDESQVADLINTYLADDDEQAPDTDPDRHVLGFDAEDAHNVTVGPWVDEHGIDRTPGQSTSPVWGM